MIVGIFAAIIIITIIIITTIAFIRDIISTRASIIIDGNQPQIPTPNLFSNLDSSALGSPTWGFSEAAAAERGRLCSSGDNVKNMAMILMLLLLLLLSLPITTTDVLTFYSSRKYQKSLQSFCGL